MFTRYISSWKGRTMTSDLYTRLIGGEKETEIPSLIQPTWHVRKRKEWALIRQLWYTFLENPYLFAKLAKQNAAFGHGRRRRKRGGAFTCSFVHESIYTATVHMCTQSHMALKACSICVLYTCYCSYPGLSSLPISILLFSLFLSSLALCSPVHA